MLQRFNAMLISVYLTVTGLVQQVGSDLRKDERGLSDVITAVLMVALAIAVVLLIWALLGDWITDFWNDITGRTDVLRGS